MDLIKEEVELDAEQPVKVRDWLNELSQRLDLVRDAARMTGLYEIGRLMIAALHPGSLRQVIWCYCVLQACMGNVKRHRRVHM